jgi:hypothetical protein
VTTVVLVQWPEAAQCYTFEDDAEAEDFWEELCMSLEAAPPNHVVKVAVMREWVEDVFGP